MTQDPKHFTIVDPRTFEGDPYEVAERGVAQIEGAVERLIEAIGPAKLMVRNAELDRQILRDEAPDAEGWPETEEGRRWTMVEDDLARALKNLSTLKKVAKFNPKKAR